MGARLTESDVMGALDLADRDWDAMPDAARAAIVRAFEDRAELLEAAQKMVDSISLPLTNRERVAYDALRAAVAKASGEGSQPTSPDCGHSACRQNWIDTGERECVQEGQPEE